MSDMLGQIRRWRSKADELFAKAEMVTNEAARDQMLQMAESYERLADQMENLVIKRRSEGPA